MTHKKQLNLSQWFIIGIAALAAAFSVLWAEQRYERELEKDLEFILQNKSVMKDKYALIEVDFGNGKKRYFQGKVGVYRYNLPEVLESAADNGDFSVKVRSGSIAELAGVSGRGGTWKIYLNGSEQKDPVEKLTVAAGDKYVLRYE